MPNVSVIIPTCNRVAYLKNAIATVINQTFQDFELIVVDDASDDDTPDLLRDFQDGRVKYIRHEKRKGAAAARNTGILASNAAYIAFLDDDDEWYPEKLSRQMDLFLASPPNVGCVYSGYITVDRAAGKKTGQMIPSKRGDLSKDLLLSNCIGGTSCAIVRKKCLEEVGLFDETLPSFQDYDVWIRLSREFNFDYIRDPLLTYFVHQNKIWSNPSALHQGMQLMLRKYGESRAFQKYLSYHYLTLGVNYCGIENMHEARRCYLQAIYLHPVEFRHYFNLCLSLFGPTVFRKIKEAKADFMTSSRLSQF